MTAPPKIQWNDGLTCECGVDLTKADTINYFSGDANYAHFEQDDEVTYLAVDGFAECDSELRCNNCGRQIYRDYELMD